MKKQHIFIVLAIAIIVALLLANHKRVIVRQRQVSFDIPEIQPVAFFLGDINLADLIMPEAPESGLIPGYNPRSGTYTAIGSCKCQ